MRRPALRRMLLAVASVAQTIPGLALLALFYPLLLALAALTERMFGVGLLRARLPAVGAGARALQHAAGAAEHHHRPARHRSGGDRGRARRRHDAAAVADHGRAAARAAGDHGRHPHRGGVGDRHRDAVDADRADEPRQLHLHRLADAELGVRAVRLRRGGAAGARGRSVAGADGDRRRQAQPPARRVRRRRARAACSRRRCCRRWRGRAPTTSSARSRSPSNTCSPP